jgi:hypothetical protein
MPDGSEEIDFTSEDWSYVQKDVSSKECVGAESRTAEYESKRG